MVFIIRSTEYGTRALYSTTEREDKAVLQGLLDEGVFGFVGNRVPPNDAVVSQRPIAVRTLLGLLGVPGH